MQPLDLFRERLPHRPYCSDDLSTGLLIRRRDQALQRRYLQHSPPVLLCWLVFDIDRPGGVLAWEDANLAAPNFTIRTPSNQHGQLFYGLLVPVCTSDAARQEPLRLAAAIQRAYTAVLEADRSYNGMIAKNPFHPDWDTVCWAVKLYELGELAGWVELDKYTPKPGAVDWNTWGLGRNCTLFARLGPGGKWAYREIRRYWDGPRSAWEERVLSKALEWNGEFRDPLPYNEVRYLARSVARFTWRQFTPASFQDLVARTHTPELQAARGQRGGVASAERRRVEQGELFETRMVELGRVAGIASGHTRQLRAEQRRALVLTLAGQGLGPAEIAARTGLAQRTIYHYLKRPRDDQA